MAPAKAQTNDACGAATSDGGLTGIYVAASFLPVCTTSHDGTYMGVTANNICIGGSHWGAPFLKLRGGAQGLGDAQFKKEIGQAKTKRQARVERGKKLTAVMGQRPRRGRHRKKVALEDQHFKSEWHREKALKQAERRLSRKMARKIANSTSARPSIWRSQDSLTGRTASESNSNVPRHGVHDKCATEDGDGQLESVPQSFLEEFERTQQGKSDGVASSESSGSRCVVLDGDGNEVVLDTPLEAVPGREEKGVGEDDLERIAQGAVLRPYTDAQGNVKWIDSRSASLRQEHVWATMGNLGHAPNLSLSANLTTELERLRGGNDAEESDGAASRWNLRAGAVVGTKVPPKQVHSTPFPPHRSSLGYAGLWGHAKMAEHSLILPPSADPVGSRPLISSRCSRKESGRGYCGIMPRCLRWRPSPTRCSLCLCVLRVRGATKHVCAVWFCAAVLCRLPAAFLSIRMSRPGPRLQDVHDQRWPAGSSCAREA